MVVAGRGNRANKGASPFGAGQVGSIPDSPQFEGGHAATLSPASAEAPSTADVPEFTAPTDPLQGSPGSFVVLDVATDAPVGSVTPGNAPTATGDRRQADIAGEHSV
jgi:hypothetical protein